MLPSNKGNITVFTAPRTMKLSQICHTNYLVSMLAAHHICCLIRCCFHLILMYSLQMLQVIVVFGVKSHVIMSGPMRNLNQLEVFLFQQQLFHIPTEKHLRV